MSSGFQIYEDAEKENPPQHMKGSSNAGILKERKIMGTAAAKNVGNTSGIGGARIAAKKVNTLDNKHHAQTRSGFVPINGNANMGNGFAATARNVKNNNNTKLALRQVENHNVHNKNISNNNNNKKLSTKVIGTKKSAAVVPVVEQFKTISVYEDNQNENDHHTTNKTKVTTTLTTSSSSSTTTTTTSTINAHLTKIQEENHLVLEHQQKFITKNDSLDKDFGCHIDDDENVFNTTPMSVSDVLSSPMSIDRSSITFVDSDNKENHPELFQRTNDLNSALETVNEEEQENVEQQQQQQQQEQQQLKIQLLTNDKIPAPRNDRQRFFEVVEYQLDILEYFRESEKKHLPKPNYMQRQQDISHSMRTILVDWLVEVSEEYNLDTETLYLSISYIDRFLSHMSVVRSKLQLVGTAAMYIAAKYEEIYPPDVGEFVFITDDTYTKAQVLRMEQLILKILAFDLCTPTPYVFANTYAVLTDMTYELKFLTMYISELSLLQADPYLRYVPSLISAASHALARYILDYDIWTADLEEITSYRLEDLKEVFLSLCKTHKAALTLPQQAIQEKYKGKKYNAVATLQPVEVTPEQYDEMTLEYNEAAAAAKNASSGNQQESMAVANNENVRRMISLMFN